MEGVVFVCLSVCDLNTQSGGECVVDGYKIEQKCGGLAKEKSKINKI